MESINDSNELVDGGKKSAIDDLEDGELEKFISKLGIRAYAGQQNVPDEPVEGDATEGTQSGNTTAAAKTAKSDEQKSKPEIKGKDQPGKEDKKTKKKTKETATGKKAKQNVNLFEFQPRKLLLIKPGGKWFDMDYTLEGTSDRKSVV